MLGSFSSGYEQRCPEDELEEKLGPKHQTPAGDELGTAPSLVKVLRLKCGEAASNCNTHGILSEKASFLLHLFENKTKQNKTMQSPWESIGGQCRDLSLLL